MALIVAAGDVGASNKVTYFRIGTGATGGTYFPIGTIIANAISRPPAAAPCERGGSCGVPGLIATAQTTHGSVQNVLDIASGSLQSGLVQADIAWAAWKGTGRFRKGGPRTGLRVIANLYREQLHLVVRRDSPVRSVADLRGKRVSIGEKESGTLVHARLVLRAYGLRETSLKAQNMTPSQAALALRDGKLDAFFLVAGYPAVSIQTLSEETPIRLVGIDAKVMARLTKQYPFFSGMDVPASAYKGTEEVATLSVGAQWLVSADVDPALVYGITKALWHPRTRTLLVRGHPQGRHILLKTALEGVTLPLHPGAARYYREVGLIKPAAQDPDGKPAPGQKPKGEPAKATPPKPAGN